MADIERENRKQELRRRVVDTKELLQQEAASRQILLFTCQSREAQALEN